MYVVATMAAAMTTMAAMTTVAMVRRRAAVRWVAERAAYGAWQREERTVLFRARGVAAMGTAAMALSANAAVCAVRCDACMSTRACACMRVYACDHGCLDGCDGEGFGDEPMVVVMIRWNIWWTRCNSEARRPDLGGRAAPQGWSLYAFVVPGAPPLLENPLAWAAAGAALCSAAAVSVLGYAGDEMPARHGKR
jgi:hypothetical protein